MANRGRKIKYDPTFHPKIAKYMARCGMKDTEIARDLKIAESTLNNWKKIYPELMESLKENKNFIDSMVEDSLLKRAIGYEVSEIVDEEIVSKEEDEEGKTAVLIKRKVYKKKILPDVTAQIFWLKNRQRDRWRDVYDHSVVDNTEYDKVRARIEEIAKKAKESYKK